MDQLIVSDSVSRSIPSAHPILCDRKFWKNRLWFHSKIVVACGSSLLFRMIHSFTKIIKGRIRFLFHTIFFYRACLTMADNFLLTKQPEAFPYCTYRLQRWNTDFQFDFVSCLPQDILWCAPILLICDITLSHRNPTNMIYVRTSSTRSINHSRFDWFIHSIRSF